MPSGAAPQAELVSAVGVKRQVPFNQSLGTQKVLYNCPAIPPKPPAYSGYTFVSWSPSVTAGMKSNTTFTANYIDNSSIMSVPGGSD